MARFALVLMSSLLTLGLAASAQTIQVSRDNKTIYVTSEGEAKAEPEIAILTLGYHAWSITKDALYDENVAWDVVDRTGLQAEASKNALGKARTVADSMALGLGTKLGALVYASNSAPIRPSNWPFFSGLNTSTASVSGVIGTPLPPKIIKLLPEKINEKTTVYAVFAIE